MKKYKRIAELWHGGQFTAMYSYLSTGSILDGLEDEIKENFHYAKGKDKKELVQFLNYVVSQKSNIC